MEKLRKLLNQCKCGVYLSVNEHRDYYEAVERYLLNRTEDGDIEPEILAKMIETDTVISLQFYPDTPVGFYAVWHHDLDAALDEALACLR